MPDVTAAAAALRHLPLQFLIALIAWSLFWKGLALWRAARRDEKVWYIVLLLVNTVGLLEILYLFAFAREKASGSRPDRRGG